jgi:hypothetical protein
LSIPEEIIIIDELIGEKCEQNINIHSFEANSNWQILKNKKKEDKNIF